MWWVSSQELQAAEESKKGADVLIVALEDWPQGEG